MDIQLKRGYLEICVLASMIREETYGYKLIRDLSRVVDISESTLYPILRRLETSGCVKVRSEAYNSRLRKYYSITDAGRARIDEFMNDWGEILKIYNYITEESKNE